MVRSVFLAQLAFIHQFLNVRVIFGSKLLTILAQVIDPRIAHVDDAGPAVRQQGKTRHRAVGLFFSGDRCQLDHQVRFPCDLRHRGLGVISHGVEAVEDLLGRQHDLVRGLAPATASAHAIGHHAHDASLHTGVLQETDLILLIGTVALMDGGGGADSIGQGGVKHAGNYKPAAL